MNKYRVFFTDLIQFCKKNNLSSENDFIGLSEFKIDRFQKDIGVSFPLALREYLKLMGKKYRIKNCSVINATKQSISSAETQAKKKGIRQRIKNLKIFNENDQELSESINNICFIHWVDYNGYFSFVKEEDHACNIYGWDYDDYIYKWDETLISEIRKQILFGLIMEHREHYLDIKKLNNLPRELFEDHIINDKRKIQNVLTFNAKINESEKNENTLINMDDYLQRFIIERHLNPT